MQRHRVAGVQPGQATPATRDRYVDALRAGSLLVVIIGHWLMADVGLGGEVGNALVSAPALQLLTWVLQVMPLFFLVGGVAHAHALASLDRRGVSGPGRYAAFVGSRASRLLRPTLVLIGVWVGVGLLVRAGGVTQGADGPLVLTALRLVTQPLWFVGIYLGVAALAPAMLAAHRRWGARVAVLLVAAAVGVDLLRFTAGLDALATLNFALVWLALHQLGFCWHSGLLPRPVAVGLVAGAAAALVTCVTVGPYPTSMVGLPGDELSNMSPPTAALLAQGTALAGVAVLLREPVTRLLARPRVWGAVRALGAVTMTAFLWHLTALFLAVLGLRVLGVGTPQAATRDWWLTRPPWLLVLAVLTVGLVAVFRRFDSARPAAVGTHPRRGADVAACLGAALTVLGVLMVSVTGVDLVGSPTVHFVVLDVTPVAALAVLAAGTVVLALLPRGASPLLPRGASTLAGGGVRTRVVGDRPLSRHVRDWRRPGGRLWGPQADKVVGGDRSAVQRAAGGITQRGDDGRGGDDGRHLADTLESVGSTWVRLLHRVGLDGRHVQDRGDQVVGERGVPDDPVLNPELLHQGKAEPLGGAAFDLTLEPHRVEDLPGVDRRHDLHHPGNA